MNINNWINTHRYSLALLYLIPFLLGFLILELIDPVPRIILHCFIDDLIPFNEWFVIPYFIWYAWVPVFLLYFMIKDRTAFLHLCFVMFSGCTVCLILYAVLPSGLDLRREITSQNICAWIVRTLRMIDPPSNVCPSIHASSTAAVHTAILASSCFKNPKKMRILSWIITSAICISTMFIKQHSFIDVVCGWVLTTVMDLLWIHFVKRLAVP